MRTRLIPPWLYCTRKKSIFRINRYRRWQKELGFHEIFERIQLGRSNVYTYISSRVYHAQLGKCDMLRHWKKFVLLAIWSIQTSFLNKNIQQWPISGIKIGINLLSFLKCECQIRAGLIVHHIAMNLPRFNGCQHAGAAKLNEVTRWGYINRSAASLSTKIRQVTNRKFHRRSAAVWVTGQRIVLERK